MCSKLQSLIITQRYLWVYFFYVTVKYFLIIYYLDEYEYNIHIIKFKEVFYMNTYTIEDKNIIIGFNTTSTEECLEAVKQNGLTLRYVKEQTPEICFEAVKTNGYALRYVKEQTPEI